jgi:hypothetical protein
MKDKYIKSVESIKNFLLNTEVEVQGILNYILSRIKENKNEIEQLLKIYNDNSTYEMIEQTLENEIEDISCYGDYSNLSIDKENNFLSANIKSNIGLIAVESYKILDIIKWLTKAIKFRNGIVISDAEYSENNAKMLILYIFKECLEKYNISKELINICPYEGVYYEWFDKVIYTYDEEGKYLDDIKVEDNIETSNNKYVYIENEEFEKEALQNSENAIYLKGNFEENILKINETINDVAVIYTKDKEKASEFINLVRSNNVFVNSNISNAIKIENSIKTLYREKHIIIPIPEEKRKYYNRK